MIGDMSQAMSTIVVSVVVMLGVVLPGLFASRARRQEKHEDWAREDQVKLQTAKATALLLESNNKIVSAAKTTLREITEVREQGNVIHGLVNASYTAALEAQRVALVGQLASLTTLNEFRVSAGRGAVSNGTIVAIEKQISVLETNIQTRLEQQHLAEEQVALAKGV